MPDLAVSLDIPQSAILLFPVRKYELSLRPQRLQKQDRRISAIGRVERCRDMSGATGRELKTGCWGRSLRMFPQAGRVVDTASLHQVARGSVLESRHARQRSISALGGAVAASMDALSASVLGSALPATGRERTRYVGGLKAT
jgi:hypothetical protein